MNLPLVVIFSERTLRFFTWMKFASMVCVLLVASENFCLKLAGLLISVNDPCEKTKDPGNMKKTNIVPRLYFICMNIQEFVKWNDPVAGLFCLFNQVINDFDAFWNSIMQQDDVTRIQVFHNPGKGDLFFPVGGVPGTIAEADHMQP